MIRIKQIDFQNYRIAGTFSLSFKDTDNGYHMHGIIASNGTGKTTILNAITWCLYGEEYQLKDADTALPIINSKKLHDMKKDESADVVVKLTITDEDKEIVYERRHRIIKTEDDNGVPVPIPEPRSEFVVTESDLSTAESTKSFRNEEAEYRVAEYFENKIHDFFFFDGERLGELFTVSKANSIQSSVEAIAQISLLDTVTRNAGEISDKYSRKVSKGHPNVKKLEKERDKIKSDLESDEAQHQHYEEECGNLKEEKKAIDALLQEHSVSKTLQENKRLLEENISLHEKNLEDLSKRKVRLAVRGVTLIHLYPSIKRSLKLIREKGEAGDYSVLLSRKQLRAILDDASRHAAGCPVCGSSLGISQIRYIQDIISRQTVDDDTSLSMRTLEEDLKEAEDELLGFRSEYEKILKDERDLDDSLSKAKRELSAVSEKISRLGTARDENGKELDFTMLERKSNDLASKIDLWNKAIWATEDLIKRHEDEYKQKCREYDDAVRAENEDKDLQKIIDTLGMVKTNLTSVKNSLASDVRNKLEEITRKIFMSVVRKKETFGKVSISDSYHLSLYDEYGQEMTGSSSATEYMILAYSYTLAIHEASGHNCPLVIDSPLGRVSGEIRETTADMLLETSRNKQIIMLFTEDEYSERVRNLFKGKAQMQTITLADNEKTWKGAEV